MNTIIPKTTKQFINTSLFNIPWVGPALWSQLYMLDVVVHNPTRLLPRVVPAYAFGGAPASVAEGVGWFR